MDVQQQLSELGQTVQAMGKEMRELIKDVRGEIPVRCSLCGSWLSRGEICRVCEKLKTEIVNDNCKSPEEICEDGECDCDPGECVAREQPG